ncbi:MAG TPA: T9SS type A sorting domain-containing protein, partial [Ignavibacteriaceae bacterium]
VIKYSVPNVIANEVKQSQMVTLKVYDVLGSEIVTLVNEEKSAGTYEVYFNAAGLSSGVYLYKLITENFSETKKMLLLR